MRAVAALIFLLTGCSRVCRVVVGKGDEKMYMGRFACEETYPAQRLKKNNDGSFTWDINDGWLFQMHFDANGNFAYSLQENYEGGIDKFERPNGKEVDPLTKDQMSAAL